MIAPILSLNKLSKYYVSNTGHTIKALDDINLNILPGEFVVIIGKNGCGKSTLLKSISGIVKPTAGEILLYGSLTAINDWGSGLEPEISGYDNIKMIGRLHRLDADKIRLLREFVEEFSELGSKLNEPVKNYSQGMYLRLAFSINAFLNTDMLVFDEILAVGDVQFRKKCYDYLESEFIKGKTVIVATHSFEELRAHCTRCIWLNDGRVVMDGLPDAVYLSYIKFLYRNMPDGSMLPSFVNLKPEIMEIKNVYVLQDGIKANQVVFWKDFEIVLEWEKRTPAYGVTFTVFIVDSVTKSNVLSVSDNYGIPKTIVPEINAVNKGVYREVVNLKDGLLNIGIYNIVIYASYFVSDDDDELVSFTSQPLQFEVVEDPEHLQEYIWKFSQAPIRLKNNLSRFYVGL